MTGGRRTLKKSSGEKALWDTAIIDEATVIPFSISESNKARLWYLLLNLPLIVLLLLSVCEESLDEFVRERYDLPIVSLHCQSGNNTFTENYQITIKSKSTDTRNSQPNLFPSFSSSRTNIEQWQNRPLFSLFNPIRVNMFCSPQIIRRLRHDRPIPCSNIVRLRLEETDVEITENEADEQTCIPFL